MLCFVLQVLKNNLNKYEIEFQGQICSGTELMNLWQPMFIEAVLLARSVFYIGDFEKTTKVIKSPSDRFFYRQDFKLKKSPEVKLSRHFLLKVEQWLFLTNWGMEILKIPLLRRPK